MADCCYWFLPKVGTTSVSTILIGSWQNGMSLFCLPTALKWISIGQIQRWPTCHFHIWKEEMSVIQEHLSITGLVKKIAVKNGVLNAHFRNLLMTIWNVNIKVAVAKWLQKHYFDAEYTIRQLPTDDQHAKDGFCGKTLEMRYFSLIHYRAIFSRCWDCDIRLNSLNCITNVHFKPTFINCGRSTP